MPPLPARLKSAAYAFIVLVVSVPPLIMTWAAVVGLLSTFGMSSVDSIKPGFMIHIQVLPYSLISDVCAVILLYRHLRNYLSGVCTGEFYKVKPLVLPTTDEKPENFVYNKQKVKNRVGLLTFTFCGFGVWAFLIGMAGFNVYENGLGLLNLITCWTAGAILIRIGICVQQAGSVFTMDGEYWHYHGLPYYAREAELVPIRPIPKQDPGTGIPPEILAQVMASRGQAPPVVTPPAQPSAPPTNNPQQPQPKKPPKLPKSAPNNQNGSVGVGGLTAEQRRQGRAAAGQADTTPPVQPPDNPPAVNPTIPEPPAQPPQAAP